MVEEEEEEDGGSLSLSEKVGHSSQQGTSELTGTTEVCCFSKGEGKHCFLRLCPEQGTVGSFPNSGVDDILAEDIHDCDEDEGGDDLDRGDTQEEEEEEEEEATQAKPSQVKRMRKKVEQEPRRTHVPRGAKSMAKTKLVWGGGD